MEADEKSAYYNVQVGWAPTWRISKRNSTDNASWAGVPTWKLTKSQLPISVEYKNTH